MRRNWGSYLFLILIFPVIYSDLVPYHLSILKIKWSIYFGTISLMFLFCSNCKLFSLLKLILNLHFIYSNSLMKFCSCFSGLLCRCSFFNFSVRILKSSPQFILVIWRGNNILCIESEITFEIMSILQCFIFRERWDSCIGCAYN